MTVVTSGHNLDSLVEEVAADVTLSRIDEAVAALRYKPVCSTTLERIRITEKANHLVAGYPQPLKLGEGLYYLLDRIAVPVFPDDLIVGRIEEEVPDDAGEVFFWSTVARWNGKSIPAWMPDGGHECFGWDRLLRFGFSGLEDYAKEQLERRTAEGEQGDRLDYLRGVIRVYQAFRCYVRRYADSAREAGLEEAASWCDHVADHPPATFGEAMQLMWLVGIVYCTMVACNATLTFGRMDELLLPFYRKDVVEGRLTYEKAGDLIEDFYCKNNLILGRGEHQMSHSSEKDTGWARNLTYDAPQYVILGGRRGDGAPVANELTTLFLERIVPRFKNPVVVVRYTNDLPEPTWRLACDKMRDNASMMVYSDEQVIPAMIHCGIAPEDALTYTMHGCNWPDIPGKQRSVYLYFVQLPRTLRKALLSMDGEISNIEEVYERFIRLLRVEFEEHTDRFRRERKAWDYRAPGMLRVDDCFLDGPVANARSWAVGGVKYPNMILSITGLASATDTITALDELVFRSSKATMDMLLQALQNDFTGQERLRRFCMHAPKYGQGDDCADQHAVRLLESINLEIDRVSRIGYEDEVNIFRCLETDMKHIHFGKDLGATPDGRHAGQPISENTSPAPGACKNGLTAMFNSMSILPFDRINSGALNLRMQPVLFAGPDGLQRLSELLRTYFDMGGLQVQLSFASVQELREAQLDPERYRDLMIRITGYSAAFVDMTREAQDEIIRREEMAC
jgi:formate C-acetyltransferase